MPAQKAIILGMELRTEALRVLCISDPTLKAQAALALPTAAKLSIDRHAFLAEPTGLPGRPPLPKTVPADQVPRRSPFTLAGRCALLHAICHIEFNAINLALDAIWRFPGLPEAYYRDWLQVAHEEALHFSLLQAHLHSLGCHYGDFDAHDGLWTMTRKTAGDVLARMALVPRTLEARGLDATPPIQAKLKQAGDHRAVEILDIILRDEIGHVAIGNRWYRWLCEQAGLDPHVLYPQLVERYQAPRLKGPFNFGARRAAGFSEAELEWLGGLPAPGPHRSSA